MNTSLIVWVFNSAWKLSIVRSRPKCESTSSYKDLRSITILPYPSKILKKICVQQLTFFVNKNRFLSSCQSRFRKGSSAKTTILHVSDEIGLLLDCPEVILIALFDFFCALERLGHGLLLTKLRRKVCQNLLSVGISVFFRTENNVWRSLTLKLRQCLIEEVWLSACRRGQLKGPTLFSIYTICERKFSRSTK